MRHTSFDITKILQLIKRMFSPPLEDRISLRVLVLVLAWWVAISLAWVGTAHWIWFGSALLLTVGHGFSWRYRNHHSVFRSAIIAITIVGALVLFPRTVSSASAGDWLPAAQFLLLFQAIASFEIRSRGGLWAAIAISGAIEFFVSQRALDASFGVFVTGYTALFLAFLAMSFLVDHAKNSEVRWFTNRYSFAGFWSGVFVVSMVASLAIFLLLPKQFGDPINNPQGAVLPIRNTGDMNQLESEAVLEGFGSALPVTFADLARDGILDEIQSAAAGSSDSDTLGNTGRRSTRGTDSDQFDGRADGVVWSSAGRVGDANSATNDPNIDSGNPIVMQVRSPVLTYWRGQVFDTFDGSRWRSSTSPWVSKSRGSSGVVYAAPRPPGVDRWPFYSATFFAKEAAPIDVMYTGYTPLLAAVSVTGNDGHEISDGSIYRIISALPDFSAEALSTADPSVKISRKYSQLPDSSEELTILAQSITRGAFTDLGRTQRIAAFLDGNYTYDFTAPNQMALSGSPSEFLLKKSRGTSMDFATATVLLARAAGIPARLVVGFLPGRFDPLSGTYIVRESDQHTWSEIYFGGFGWVPVDSAPSISNDLLENAGVYDSSLGNSFLRRDYAGDIYASLRATPSNFTEAASRVLDDKVLTAGMVIGVLVTALGVAALLFKLWPNGLSIRRKQDYSRLDGEARQEMRNIYRRAEKLLAHNGAGKRTTSQTIAEHAQGLGPDRKDIAAHHSWLKEAAWEAMYNPDPYDPNMVVQARDRLKRLRMAFRSESSLPQI